VGGSPADAVGGADLVATCLFGPQAVHEVVLDADLAMPPGSVWVDISTVGPVVARASDAWADARGLSYVHSPVLGSLGPARARDLGVLIGAKDAAARATARSVVSVWADPARLVEYDDPAKAAVGKLVVNLSLAVGYQGLIEAVQVGRAGGLSTDEALALAGLPKTPFSVIAGMKGAALASGDYADTQFSAGLLAKDADLMLSVAAGRPLPALSAAFAALEHACRAGLAEADFSAMAFDAGLAR